MQAILNAHRTQCIMERVKLAATVPVVKQDVKFFVLMIAKKLQRYSPCNSAQNSDQLYLNVYHLCDSGL